MSTISELVEDWGGFEEFGGVLFKNSSDVTVEHNVKLYGRSETPRVIDILIRQRIPPTSEIRTIVECKYLSRNVERAEVDALRTVLNETQCHKGVILSRVGFQRGAIAAAKELDIDLFTVRGFKASELAVKGPHRPRRAGAAQTASSAGRSPNHSSGTSLVRVVFDLGFARRARHDAIDAVAVIRLLGLQNEAELFEHDAREEPPHGMLLPAGGLHDGGNRCTLGPAQQFEDGGLFGFRTRLGLSRLAANGGFLRGCPRLHLAGEL
jgi:hypothetical protein